MEAHGEGNPTTWPILREKRDKGRDMGRILTPFAPSQHIGHLPDLPSSCGGLRPPISGEKCDLIVTTPMSTVLANQAWS
jgi:hypothetical protein